MISLGSPRLFQTAVPAHPARAASVRRMVTAHLKYWRLREIVDCAVLATDELFANAVKHGSNGPDDTITITLACSEHELRVEVADSSSLLPALLTAAAAEESGRGLAIVAALADDWGTAPPEPGHPGKRVWFTLPLTRLP
jgi:anti-sigma regulatory factor (Ser/Thr protein kinase)